MPSILDRRRLLWEFDPMRCQDLTRELASPAGRLSAAEMAGHLAECPACAEWSRKAARFDQIWETTRPIEPSSAMLDALWANASVALESRSTAPAPLRLVGSGSGRRSWIRPALVLAQAAAILVAAGVLFTAQRPVKPPQVVQKTQGREVQPIQVATTRPVVSSNPLDFGRVNVNVDQVAVVSIPADKKIAPKVTILEESPSNDTNEIPANNMHSAFNDMEVAANSADGR